MKKTTTKLRSQSGFTLIELLIVVVIIGILAAIAIPKFASTRERAYKAAMMSDLKNLANHQEVYHNTYFTFSTDLTALESVLSDAVTIVVSEASNGGWAGTAIHAGMTGEQCGIYHGDAAAAGGSPATVPSVVTCSY